MRRYQNLNMIYNKYFLFRNMRFCLWLLPIVGKKGLAVCRVAASPYCDLTI